jgi:hypothetical protein
MAILSDVIITKLPKELISIVNDYKPLSSNCDKLREKTMETQIININKTFFNNINSIVFYVGNYERTSGMYLDSSINNQIDTINHISINGKKGFDIIKRDIIGKLNITTNLYSYKDDFYLEKKIMEAGVIKKNYFKIIKSELVGTGNLSTSLILRLKIAYNESGLIKNRDICIKVYPLDIYDIHVTDKILSSNKKQNMIDLSKYIVIREGLIGCWVNKNLLKPHLFPNPITDTVMDVSDTYFVNGIDLDEGKHIVIGNGLPFSYDKLKTIVYDYEIVRRKKMKNWVSTNLDDKTKWLQNIARKQYGYIEMEPLLYTLSDLYKKNNIVDENIIFEIIYTKLCFHMVGNFNTPDDHSENIMLTLDDDIREYNIKSRNTIYKFFIDSRLKIKYVDLERIEKLSDRNHLNNQDCFPNYFNISGDDYANTTNPSFLNMFVNKIYETNLLNICDILYQILPDKITDETLYIGKQTKKFYLDLDKSDTDYEPSMLFDLSSIPPRNKPYKEWNGRLEF